MTRSLFLALASVALSVGAPTLAAAQTFTVNALPPIDLGQIVAGAQTDTTFRGDAETGSVTIVSGSAVRRSASSGRGLVTISCEGGDECEKFEALITIAAAGKGTNRAGPLDNFRISTSGATAKLSSKPPSGSVISFAIAPIGRNSSKSFWLGFDLVTYGDNSSRRTGLSSAPFAVTVSRPDGSEPHTLTGAVEAVVTRGLAIAKTADLSFGRIVAPTVGAGVVTLDPGTGGVEVEGQGAAALSSPGPSAAAFVVTGEGGQAVSISVPSSFTIAGPSGSLKIKTLPSLSGSQVLGGSLGSAGTLEIKVGGALEINAATPPGNYTGKFGITVQYN